MDEKTSNTGWVYFAAILIFSLGLVLFLWESDDTKTANARKSAIASSASGIFIIPAGGEEISRDTAGQRFFPNNVGEIVAIHTISPKNPSRLFFLNESGTRIKIDPGLTRIEITDIGKKPYIRFANYSDRTAKIKVL